MMPRVFIFGNTSFSRASIPAILADFEQLPTVDESALTPELREAYKNNLEAYRLFVAEKDVPLRQIRDLTGVDPKQLYLLLQRVLVKAEDGRIQGLRGLIPFKHMKEADDQPASVEAQPDMEFERWPVGNVPFKLVQFDGHKIDVRLTLVVNDPFGMKTVIEIARIWILVVKDVSTRCVLGYYIAYGVEYNKDDVAEAIQAAIVPHRRMKMTIPGLEIKEGGGFPNEVMPELEYHRLSWFHYDTAKSHIAQDSLDRLADVLGCWTMSGRLGIADDRAIIERFFGLLEEFFHQIPGTTGSKPTDPVRRLGNVGRDLYRLMTVEELEQVVEVVIGNKNGEASSALGGRTPLEAMMYQTSKPEFLLQTLPVSRRHQLFLLKEATIKVVRGAKTAPHINFEGVKYTSDLLTRRHELVGKILRIYFIARDIRTIHAFFEDGSELGVLVASRQWRKTPHSLRLRQEILRNIRLGFLRVGPGDDPVEAYVRNKRKAATESKRAGNSLAKVRAGIAAANSAAAFGDTPFGPTAPPETALSDEQASRSVPKKKAKPGEVVVPVPLTLKKTLLF